MSDDRTPPISLPILIRLARARASLDGDRSPSHVLDDLLPFPALVHSAQSGGFLAQRKTRETRVDRETTDDE
jgi:hypothetical protein